MLFDRSRLMHRPALPGVDFLYQRAAEELVDRLSVVSREFRSTLVSAPVTPALRGALAGLPGLVCSGPTGLIDVRADVRQPFLRRFDLAIGLNDLHLANDPVMALGELRGTLKPDGLFLGAALSSGSLNELADAFLAADSALSSGAAMRVAPFADVRKWGDALARAGFALPVADEVSLTVRYRDFGTLLAELRAMAGSGILAERRACHRRLFEKAGDYYRETHADEDGKLRLTFNIAFLSGWAPAPSQQKPAKRGSANVRLEDALNQLKSGS